MKIRSKTENCLDYDHDDDDDDDDDNDDDDDELFWSSSLPKKSIRSNFQPGHCQRYSPSQISDTLLAGYKLAQKLSLSFDE